MDFVLLQLEEDSDFDALSQSPCLRKVAQGRQGGILIPESEYIPLVRSTTAYPTSAAYFSPAHCEVLEKLRNALPGCEFNNAMLEVYDAGYWNMGFHTDQTLDLELDSVICLFSCYNAVAKESDYRTLEIENKLSGAKRKITLLPQSVVVFSTQVNQEHRHRIIMETLSPTAGAQWLGMTFRKSKTLLRLEKDQMLLLSTGEPLRMAEPHEKKEFYRMKSKENASPVPLPVSYVEYTLSPGDLLPPTKE